MNQAARAQLKTLRILSRRLAQGTLAGDYRSAFRGSGMEFHQLREYQPGDDVRRISWNSLAKTGKLLIKQFIEEHDRLVVLVVDRSASLRFSSTEQLGSDVVGELALVFALAAEYGHDRFAALLFSDAVHAWMPPARGMPNVVRLLERLHETPGGAVARLDEALRFLHSLNIHNAIVIMISDWLDDITSCSSLMKVLSYKHELIAVRVLDATERELPHIGTVSVVDPETGEQCMIDGADVGIRRLMHERLIEQERFFYSMRTDLLDIISGRPYLHDIISFFHRRIRRTI